MTEQFSNQVSSNESFMQRCKDAANAFSLKVAELVEIDASTVEQQDN